MKSLSTLFSMLVIGSVGYSQSNENSQKTIKENIPAANQTYTESEREEGKTEEFRLVEATNNQERMLTQETTNTVQGKTVISKVQFEAQSLRGQEYIKAHTELFIIEK